MLRPKKTSAGGQVRRAFQWAEILGFTVEGSKALTDKIPLGMGNVPGEEISLESRLNLEPVRQRLERLSGPEVSR